MHRIYSINVSDNDNNNKLRKEGDFMKKLGFGMMRLPLLDENDQTSVNQEEVNKMVDLCMERGFNYFDTAYPYHFENK